MLRQAIDLMPSSGIKRSRVRDVKRFVEAASLPKAERYLRWVSVFNTEAKQDLYTDNFKRETSAHPAASIIDPWFARANGSGIVDATLLADIMTYLPNDLLVKVDIATMANSLEARSPFLDHHVIEFAASLPEKSEVAGTDHEILVKENAETIVAGGEPDSSQDGVRRSDWALVSRSCNLSCVKPFFQNSLEARALQSQKLSSV